MKKNQFFTKKLILALFLSPFMNAQAQTLGTWQGSSAQTQTNNAVGVGTSAPAGWEEISYCDKAQKGLIVTNRACGYGATNYLPITWDGMVEAVSLLGNAEPSSGNSYYTYPVSDLTLKAAGAFGGNGPMIWARAENRNSSGNFSGTHTSRFIVTPQGTSGVNIEVPRATFDIKSLGSWNYPGMVVGRQTLGIAGRTQHVMFIPLLDAQGYNRISNKYDQGMFFTDGKGPAGSNQNGAFVLAPWSNDNTKGGLRMDKDGNVELRGTLKTTKVIVNPSWWPDFVFSDEYERISLYDLEKYINENSHLPEMPSEKEAIENGISLHELIALQLQKIEELTLYTIEQQKEIDTLKNNEETQNNPQDELTKLKTEMELLKQQMDILINK